MKKTLPNSRGFAIEVTFFHTIIFPKSVVTLSVLSVSKHFPEKYFRRYRGFGKQEIQICQIFKITLIMKIYSYKCIVTRRIFSHNGSWVLIGRNSFPGKQIFAKKNPSLKYKNIFAKGHTPNWSEEVFIISKIENTIPQTYVINDRNGEELTGTFYEKELQKTNRKEFRIEKVIKRKGDKLYVKWKGYNNSFNSWIDKKDLV